MEVAEHGVIYDDTTPGIHGEVLIDTTGMTVKLVRDSVPDTEEIYEYSPNGNLISKATQKIVKNTWQTEKGVLRCVQQRGVAKW